MTSPLLACILALAPPQDLRGEIELAGGRGLALSPTGDLWLGSRGGRVYVSRDWNQTWSVVDVGARVPDGLGSDGDAIEQLRFFDAEHALLAGYIGGDEKDEILRTADGGRTWTRAKLGQGLWVYDAQVMPDGHAWLCGSSGDVLASDDFGATWRVAGQPFDWRIRAQSVCFATPERGAVGALHDGLKLTADGGRTWTAVRTPLDEGRVAKTDEDEESSVRVCLVGSELCVLQRGRLFHRPPSSADGWREVALGGGAVLAAALDAGRMLVVTENLRVSWLSAELELNASTLSLLDGRPFALATGTRGTAFLTDVSGGVCTLEKGVVACARMHTRGDQPSWPIAGFDRAVDGVLLGVSSSTLYRSRDAGTSWEALAHGKNLHDVSVARDGSHAVVLGAGEIFLWREGAELEPLPFAEKRLYQVAVRARLGDLWLATAFEAAEDQETQDMLHTSDTTLVGPGLRALLFASRDEGEHWQRIAEHPGAIVHALWYGDDGLVRMCFSDGTLHVGRIDAPDGTLVGELALLSPADHAYGGDWATWLAFPDAEHGWVGGNHFFHGASLARTSDGGRTWTELDAPPHEWTEAFRLGSGLCVRVAGLRHPGSRVELGRAGEFRELRRFETPVHDARVDAGGSLLVRLTNDEVWSLAANGGAWARLGTLPVPPR